MEEGASGTFTIIKNSIGARMRKIRLFNDKGHDLGTAHISEHDENLATGRLLQLEMERRWTTLESRDSRSDEVEKEMWGWWSFIASVKTLTQRQWFLPLFSVIWDSPQYKKWANQGGMYKPPHPFEV
jgi:hypothetical protein